MQWHWKLNKIYHGTAFVLVICNSYLLYKHIVPLLAIVLICDLVLGPLAQWITKTSQRWETEALEVLSSCQVSAFIERYSTLHAKDTRQGLSVASKIQLSTAYMHLGDLQTAMQLFRQAEPKTPESFRHWQKGSRQRAAVECAVYHNNIACTLLRCHDTEAAKPHMEALESYFLQIKALAETSLAWDDTVTILKNCLRIRAMEMALELGEALDYEEELQWLQSRFEENTAQLTKVYNRYLSAKLYENWGKPEEAEQCMAYVRQNGGDTCYATSYTQ